jgi:hypothetical protein
LIKVYSKFNIGFSYGTLPRLKDKLKYYVKNNRNPSIGVTLGKSTSSSQPKIVKQQSNIFQKQNLPKNKF